MVMNVLEDLKEGYVETYAIDCAEEFPEIDQGFNLNAVCKRDDWQPVFRLYQPPEIRFHPYTGKAMPLKVVEFTSNQITEPDIKRWITENIPDYTQRLTTKEDE